jgi:hypothetical protein
MNHPLFDLLEKLDKAGIHYTLSRHRDDTVMVTIAFVGERVEIEIFSDGHMEVLRFLGTEDILGGKELIYDLIEKNNFENKVWEKYPDTKKH